MLHRVMEALMLIPHTETSGNLIAAHQNNDSLRLWAKSSLINRCVWDQWFTIKINHCQGDVINPHTTITDPGTYKVDVYWRNPSRAPNIMKICTYWNQIFKLHAALIFSRKKSLCGSKGWWSQRSCKNVLWWPITLGAHNRVVQEWWKCNHMYETYHLIPK